LEEPAVEIIQQLNGDSTAVHEQQKPESLKRPYDQIAHAEDMISSQNAVKRMKIDDSASEKH